MEKESPFLPSDMSFGQMSVEVELEIFLTLIGKMGKININSNVSWHMSGHLSWNYFTLRESEQVDYLWIFYFC